MYLANDNRYDSMSYRRWGRSGLKLPSYLWGFGITLEVKIPLKMVEPC